MSEQAILALEDGSVFVGQSIGAAGHAVGEVVFNTSMTGYQEILTDPSYCRQIITLTYPQIGNTGINSEDEEAEQVHASALVVREVALRVSNWRTQQSLNDYLLRRGVVAIAGIDTRRLTRVLRDHGAQRGCVASADALSSAEAIRAANEFPGLKGLDLAREVSTAKAYEWREGSWQYSPGASGFKCLNDSKLPLRVIAYDFGIKRNILRLLADRGCRVKVVPADTDAQSVLSERPHGVFLSNGPGDPQPCNYAIAAIRSFIEHGVPVFGICLGHQLLGLASGARSVKMKLGHHGANHPVQEIATGKVFITSQNHGFAIDESSLPDHVHASHRSLFDQSLQGLAYVDRPAFGFQGHPEASPGPHDILKLFDRFVAAMRS